MAEATQAGRESVHPRVERDLDAAPCTVQTDRPPEAQADHLATR